MKNWLKSSAPVAGAFVGVIVALVAVLQLVVVGPMNRRFEDLRVHMDQRFEAVDQRFEATDRRIDDLRSDMNERFNDLRAEMDHRFEAVNQRFDAVDQRFDAVDRRIDAVDRRLGRVEVGLSELRTPGDRVSRNEGQIDILRDQLQTVDAPTP